VKYNEKMIIFKLDDLIWQHRTTAEDIFQKTGIGKSTISTIRNNKNINISIHTLNKLCKYFNCKISDIMEYVPDNNN
jgi:conserved domain protein